MFFCEGENVLGILLIGIGKIFVYMLFLFLIVEKG